MIYFVASILTLTAIFTLLNRSKTIIVCPICAAVVITWLAGLVGIYTGQAWADPLIIAILLGASLGALADKYGTGFGLAWKTLMVILGLPAIYYVVQRQPVQGLGLLFVLVVVTLLFNKRKSGSAKPNPDIFKECC